MRWAWLGEGVELWVVVHVSICENVHNPLSVTVELLMHHTVGAVERMNYKLLSYRTHCRYHHESASCMQGKSCLFSKVFRFNLQRQLAHILSFSYSFKLLSGLFRYGHSPQQGSLQKLA